MVTYIQIGKNPRTAINSTPTKIREEFIKQAESWKDPVPLYFYSSKSAEEYLSVILPYRLRTVTSFYMVTHTQCWELLPNIKKKQTVPWYAIEPVIDRFRSKGYRI